MLRVRAGRSGIGGGADNSAGSSSGIGGGA